MSGLATSCRTFVALAAAALLPAGHAFAAVSAAASVSLSNFSYRVIDLDPSDGIAASFTPQQSPTEIAFGAIDHDGSNPAVVDIRHPVWAGSLMPSTITTLASAQGSTGSIGPNGFAFSTQLDTLNAAPGTSYIDSRASEAGMSLYQTGENITDPVTGNSVMDMHVLGAKSLLVMEGTLTVSLTADALAAFNAYGQAPAANSTARSEATLAFEAFLFGGYYLPDPQYPNLGTDPLFFRSDIRFEQQSSLAFEKSLRDSLIVSPTGELVSSNSTGDTQLDITIPFTLTLANASQVPMLAGLNIIAQVTTRSDVVLQPIPEPGTWALMGLGLAGVALARRRQQA